MASLESLNEKAAASENNIENFKKEAAGKVEHYSSEILTNMNVDELKLIMNQMLISTADIKTKTDMVNSIVNAQLEYYLSN